MCVFRPKASSAAFLQGYTELSKGARSYEAAAFGKPVFWLYGDQDPYYSLRHSRANFDACIAAGGKGKFVTYPRPTGQNGHAIHAFPGVWQTEVDNYLKDAIPPR